VATEKIDVFQSDPELPSSGAIPKLMSSGADTSQIIAVNLTPLPFPILI